MFEHQYAGDSPYAVEGQNFFHRSQRDAAWLFLTGFIALPAFPMECFISDPIYEIHRQPPGWLRHCRSSVVVFAGFCRLYTIHLWMVYSLVVRARGLEYGGREFESRSLHLKPETQLREERGLSGSRKGLKTVPLAQALVSLKPARTNNNKQTPSIEAQYYHRELPTPPRFRFMVVLPNSSTEGEIFIKLCNIFCTAGPSTYERLARDFFTGFPLYLCPFFNLYQTECVSPLNCNE